MDIDITLPGKDEESGGESAEFKLWAKSQDIAMQFNDLIMRWRLQAIGGLATLVTITGFVVGDATTIVVRYRAMLILTSLLSCVWAGVACIDLFYYSRLLDGAVDAIIEQERKSATIKVSTTIVKDARRAWRAPWFFYLSGLVPLLFIVGWALYQLNLGEAATSGAGAVPGLPPGSPDRH
jgi:hypothetical protein